MDAVAIVALVGLAVGLALGYVLRYAVEISRIGDRDKQ